MKEYTGKRLVIVVENLPVPFDRRVWQEATALRDKGVEVTVISIAGGDYKRKEEVLDGITIYRHTMPMEANNLIGYFIEYPFALFWEFLLLLKCHLKKGFDVIQACNPPDLIFLPALPFKLIGKLFIFDHHDLCPELLLAKFKKRNFLYHIMIFFEKLTFGLSDFSIATNDSYKEVAIKRGKMDPEKVFVVRSGPSLDRLKILNPVQSLKNGCRYLVGYVGVIGKQEGLKYLIDAANYIIQKKGFNYTHFTCVGDGPALQGIIAYARERGVYSNFTFTRRIPDTELLKVLNTADICVNPDEYNEMNNKSTMNKVLEYMALKKPIVQFDLTEGKKTAQESSLYAIPNDAIDIAKKIIYLLDNPTKRVEMGLFGYNRIKNMLQWQHEKLNLYKAYKCIFSSIK